MCFNIMREKSIYSQLLGCIINCIPRKKKGVWVGSTDSGPALERFLPNTNSIEMIRPNTKNSYWAKSIWLVEKVNTYLSESAWANGSLSAIEN